MKTEKGQTLVETALMLPVLLLLLFGIVDFGRIIFTYLTLDHAGREAVRYASVQGENNLSTMVTDCQTKGFNSDDCDIRKQITNNIGGFSFNEAKFSIEDIAMKDITISEAVNENEEPDTFKVISIKLLYKYDFLTPIVNFLSPLDLENSSTMRVE